MTIADDLRAVREVLQAIQRLVDIGSNAGTVEFSCDWIRKTLDQALARIPDPEAVGECVDYCRGKRQNHGAVSLAAALARLGES
jgi:hypothetical protein